ncbi:MAG: class I SAM-dependent methyltransferase [Desulfobacteraceae bacterium]|nr:class I SAM-dependent methyltransferase [Desulfobacteraceae bacterium]
MTQREHWEKVYLTNQPDKLGWYKPHLETSLKWIKELDLSEDSNIIDGGGGASTLVDDLLNEVYRSITVVDLSKKALALAKERLGERAKLVTWLEEDITSVPLAARHYDLWHDRAVFHFLTAPEQRQQYRINLLKALRPGGHLIIAAFAPEAPPKCSGLPVERYSADKLESTLGAKFELKRHKKELHITPGGVEQMYLYCHFRKSA